MIAPTVLDVGRIASMPNPVVRNLQITQCYHDLSVALAALLGAGANWCTFATWASKQAGCTIREEDLERSIEDLFRNSAEVQVIISSVQGALERLGKRRDLKDLRSRLLAAYDPRAAAQRAAEAVAIGNLKVFAEIGSEFARFLESFSRDEPIGTADLDRFCQSLRPGEPPEGQRLLREAFEAYASVLSATDTKVRAELMFLANVRVGLHEQTRLQPEIYAAMNAATGDDDALRQRLLKSLLPGFWLRIRLQATRLIRGRLPLDVALDRLIAYVGRHIRRTMTDALMTLRLPDGRVLRLGSDLAADCDPNLVHVSHPQLATLLREIDPTPDSVVGSGTEDWSDLPDRIHFIADFFRSYHGWTPLFTAPFTASQAEQIAAGRRPDDRL